MLLCYVRCEYIYLSTVFRFQSKLIIAEAFHPPWYRPWALSMRIDSSKTLSVFNDPFRHLLIVFPWLLRNSPFFCLCPQNENETKMFFIWRWLDMKNSCRNIWGISLVYLYQNTLALPLYHLTIEAKSKLSLNAHVPWNFHVTFKTSECKNFHRSLRIPSLLFYPWKIFFLLYFINLVARQSVNKFFVGQTEKAPKAGWRQTTNETTLLLMFCYIFFLQIAVQVEIIPGIIFVNYPIIFIMKWQEV